MTVWIDTVEGLYIYCDVVKIVYLPPPPRLDVFMLLRITRRNKEKHQLFGYKENISISCS